jgi:transposase
MAFVRKIKKGDSVYLAEVQSYRENGKVKQKVLRYIGKEVDGKVIRQVASTDIEITSVKQYLNYKILHEIAEKLGLPALLGKYAKQILLLVYTQLLTKKSIYQLPAYIENTTVLELLGINKLIDKNLYEALDALEDLDFARIEDHVLGVLTEQKRERKALILDVTDTYFNGHEADWKSRKGKDGKYGKLIQIALAVTKDEGFPILHKTYEGNISNIKIFQDLLSNARLKEFDLIVLDRGMISQESIIDMTSLEQKFITGLKKNEKLKKENLNIDREDIYQPKNQIKLKNTTIYTKAFKQANGTLIAIYNPTIEIAKRERAMANENYSPEEARYMGYSLIFHNTDLSNNEVIRLYFEKDIVEKAYRELKENINLHPLRKYRLSHIQAHVKICYLAYSILSYIQYKVKPLKISAVYAIEQLQPIYQVSLLSKKNNFNWSKVVTLKNEQKKILRAIGFDNT